MRIIEKLMEIWSNEIYNKRSFQELSVAVKTMRIIKELMEI